MSDIAETRVTADELGRLLDLTGSRVRQLAKRGTLTRDEDGKYGLGEAVRAYLAYRVDAGAGGVARADLVQERARLAKAQRLKLEREADVAAGKLLDRDEIVGAYQALVATCRAKLLVIPSRAAPELVGLDEPAQAQALLTDLVHEALGELAEGR